MRVSLTKQLTKLERAFSSKNETQAHQLKWKRLFKEFGVPPDTPVPDAVPIVIEFIDPEDRSVVSRVLPFDGKMLTKKQHEVASGD